MVSTRLAFDGEYALARVDSLDDAALDRLRFGVIGFDRAQLIHRYNSRESRFSGLSYGDVAGRALFADLARCMDNDDVAGQFENANRCRISLDRTFDYVLTWQMRPTPVCMRLLSIPDRVVQYLFLRHVVAG